MAAADDFPAALARLSIAKQNRRPSPSSAAAPALRFAPGAGPRPPAGFVAMKAATGAVQSDEENPMTASDDDFEPRHASSPTDQVLQELQLYGYRPFQDEPDPRPLPEGNRVAGAIADIFDALIVDARRHAPRTRPRRSALVDGQSVPPRRHRIERELDDNEQAQRRLQSEQDGSEVKSVELERLTAEGQTLIERRDAFELMRDQAAEHFERQTGIKLATAQPAPRSIIAI